MSRHVHARPTNRSLHVVSLLAVAVAITVAALLVWNATYSAFSVTTSNGPNNWATGNITLTEDDGGVAAFNVSNLKPGDTGEKCIKVTAGGSLNKSVKLYGVSHTTSNALSTHLNLTVTQGTGGTFAGGCTGFAADGTNGTVFATGTLASFATSHTSFANGAGVWTPAGGSNVDKVYRFVYTVSSSAPNSVQGGSSAITFTWEAQNT